MQTHFEILLNIDLMKCSICWKHGWHAICSIESAQLCPLPCILCSTGRPLIERCRYFVLLRHTWSLHCMNVDSINAKYARIPSVFQDAVVAMQVIALLYYTLSYFPGGVHGLKYVMYSFKSAFMRCFVAIIGTWICTTNPDKAFVYSPIPISGMADRCDIRNLRSAW